MPLSRGRLLTATQTRNEGGSEITKKEKIAFAQGVEEGFVRAAELSSETENILRRFRPVKPTFGHNRKENSLSTSERDSRN